MKFSIKSPGAMFALPNEFHADAKKLVVSWRDFAGVTASLACAVHCAAMPLVIAYLPALGLSWMAEEGFHKWMAAICIVLALGAFIPGWRKHRRVSPVLWGFAGLALLMSAAFVLEPFGLGCANCASCHTACETTEQSTFLGAAMIAPWITPIGGLLLVVAHLLNHRFACLCCRGEQPCASNAEVAKA
ncbi:MAG: MerC domain-containing protein [Planctomycetota bacterium]|nr:MerC domain-containing protein [Planctomycetota bacterium]